MVVLLGIAKARVLPTGCLPMGFLSLWCNTAAEAAGRFHILVVGAGARGGGVVRLQNLHSRRGWRWLWVGLVVWLFEQRFLLQFKRVGVGLELHKSCPFSVDVLSSSFVTLSCCLTSGDGFMFLMDPFNLLLNSG
jgi:hypothetical protein